MSGGRFNYMDSSLKSEIFGWSGKLTNRFEDLEISQLVWDVLELIHEYDWYDSGDTGEETWLETKKKFKDRWFKQSRTKRIKELVDTALEETKAEIYKSFELEDVE